MEYWAFNVFCIGKMIIETIFYVLGIVVFIKYLKRG